MSDPAMAEIREFAGMLKCQLFASRSSVAEAFAYAKQVADASENPAAVMTAIMVLVNTIANQVEAMAE